MSAEKLGEGSRPASKPATNANEARTDQSRGREILIALLLALGLKWLWDFGQVTEEARKLVLDRLVVEASGRMVSLTRDLARGNITAQSWLTAMRHLITDFGIAGAMALLGKYELNEAEVESWVSETNLQYGYLTRFFKQIRTGDQVLGATAIGRTDLYARALWTVAWRVYAASTLARSKDTKLKPYGMRILGAADHCKDCVEWSHEGWKPLDDVPPIGSSICGSRCHCSIIVEWR